MGNLAQYDDHNETWYFLKVKSSIRNGDVIRKVTYEWHASQNHIEMLSPQDNNKLNNIILSVQTNQNVGTKVCGHVVGTSKPQFNDGHWIDQHLSIQIAIANLEDDCCFKFTKLKLRCKCLISSCHVSYWYPLKYRVVSTT